MATTGCFAGCLFNLLIGFGISMFNNIRNHGNIKFDKFGEVTKRLLLILIFFSFTNLLITLMTFLLNKWKVSKRYAYWLIFYYVVFVIVAMIQ